MYHMRWPHRKALQDCHENAIVPGHSSRCWSYTHASRAPERLASGSRMWCIGLTHSDSNDSHSSSSRAATHERMPTCCCHSPL